MISSVLADEKMRFEQAAHTASLTVRLIFGLCVVAKPSLRPFSVPSMTQVMLLFPEPKLQSSNQSTGLKRVALTGT